MNCEHCGIEIEQEPGRKPKRFCSDAHRKAFARGKTDKSGQAGRKTDKESGHTEENGHDSPRPGQPLDSQAVDGHVLTRMDLKHWRGTRPTYLDRLTGLEHLTDLRLHHRLMFLNPWQGTPEYAERVYRLVKGLTDFIVPNNMTAA